MMEMETDLQEVPQVPAMPQRQRGGGDLAVHAATVRPETTTQVETAIPLATDVVSPAPHHRLPLRRTTGGGRKKLTELNFSICREARRSSTHGSCQWQAPSSLQLSMTIKHKGGLMLWRTPTQPLICCRIAAGSPPSTQS